MYTVLLLSGNRSQKDNILLYSFKANNAQSSVSNLYKFSKNPIFWICILKYKNQSKTKENGDFNFVEFVFHQFQFSTQHLKTACNGCAAITSLELQT